MPPPETKPKPVGLQPLISEEYIDVPSQRLYCLSFGLVCQAIKVFDFFFQYLLSSEDSSTNYCRKWLIVDFALVATLAKLRIPRLRYSTAVIMLQILILWFLDGLLFDGINVNLGQRATNGGSRTRYIDSITNRMKLASTPEQFRIQDIFSPLVLITSSSADRREHLKGEHTIRMSPISTAHLNPQGQTYCLSPTHKVAHVPVVLNNTEVSSIRYTLLPPGHIDGDDVLVKPTELNLKQLKGIEQERQQAFQLVRSSPKQSEDDADEDYDESEDDDDYTGLGSSNLQQTQSVAYIKVDRPGTLRLEHVSGASGAEARLTGLSTVPIVPCPMAQFIEDKSIQSPEVYCAANDLDLSLTISISGVPPLSLTWFKEINGQVERFLVEGIKGGRAGDDTMISKRGRSDASETVKVPLQVSLTAVGTHAFALEEVTDGVGNVVHLGTGLPSVHHSHDGVSLNTKNVRSLSVLRRPSFSFRGCAPGSPASIKMGSEVPLILATSDGDALDGPWSVMVKYQPPLEEGVKPNKQHKPWRRALQTEHGKRELSLKADAPGEFTIVSVRGKYCEGDVLAPDTCKVVERPPPKADIEWHKIHECSGDTGVTASLVMHGTPPFQVYYRTQRDKESPREEHKTFASARGELTLQPERSGHYTYIFTHITDAFYTKRVDLQGPSIDQIVRPLAAAEFKSRGQEGRRKTINSCSGDTVGFDVSLKGTGPWKLEIQAVDSHSAETHTFGGLTRPDETLRVPVPKAINRDGGTFRIELVSVEDAAGCKRPVTVPGISVNVRRVQPTIKFYSQDGRRHVTILEQESASLPLRLTGEPPWKVRYRRREAPNNVIVRTLDSPNDQLRVSEKGTFELLEVEDAECPGVVMADESTYEVEWVPKPSARLASTTKSDYRAHNNSHILSPICQGLDDHVDLELTGRSPFQITYNIAKGDGDSTTVLDTPTFSSIQPHTRFQLHTSEAGRKYYEVKQIGDAAYPVSKHQNVIIARDRRLLFEQQVFARPSASFKNNNRLWRCLYDSFATKDGTSSSPDGTIILHGTPPFKLGLSVKSLTSSELHREVLDINKNVWKIDLPSYKFTTIGAHRITIESVQDALHCEQDILDPLTRSIWVDVAESAAIVPMERRENYCVGDVPQFQLEGTPPWDISYKINGKSYSQHAKVSPFSLLQQQPGEFLVTSISHQQKMCKAAVSDVRFSVHSLPSASVARGSNIYQDIHEGDQAEVVFSLIGTPPFTFTYQRSEPPSKKGGKLGKVLETHTVSGVTSNEYSIFTALEGTWTITSISDRYCRYPPAEMDEGQR